MPETRQYYCSGIILGRRVTFTVIYRDHTSPLMSEEYTSSVDGYPCVDECESFSECLERTQAILAHSPNYPK